MPDGSLSADFDAVDASGYSVHVSATATVIATENTRSAPLGKSDVTASATTTLEVSNTTDSGHRIANGLRVIVAAIFPLNSPLCTAATTSSSLFNKLANDYCIGPDYATAQFGDIGQGKVDWALSQSHAFTAEVPQSDGGAVTQQLERPAGWVIYVWHGVDTVFTASSGQSSCDGEALSYSSDSLRCDGSPGTSAETSATTAAPSSGPPSGAYRSVPMNQICTTSGYDNCSAGAEAVGNTDFNYTFGLASAVYPQFSDDISLASSTCRTLTVTFTLRDQDHHDGTAYVRIKPDDGQPVVGSAPDGTTATITANLTPGRGFSIGASADGDTGYPYAVAANGSAECTTATGA